VPASGATGFTLVLEEGGNFTQTWPVEVSWYGESAPKLSTVGLDFLVFVTYDGGDIWYGGISLLGSLPACG
jgi:hypothetical protein